MTLCLAQSLIDTHGAFIPQDALQKYIRWYIEGYLSAVDQCFDIGMATRRALGIWGRWFRAGGGSLGSGRMDARGDEEGLEALSRPVGGRVSIADSDVWTYVAANGPPQECCGNGSLMRASPIALLYSHSLPTACTLAETASSLTHPHPTNTEACIAYTTVLIRALQGISKSDIARELGGWEFRDEDLQKRFAECKTVENWEGRGEEGIRSSGWVVDTLEAACWAFFSTKTFQEGALKVVNLGTPFLPS
jgi:ADP-ribosylglycohydrolase